MIPEVYPVLALLAGAGAVILLAAVFWKGDHRVDARLGELSGRKTPPEDAAQQGRTRTITSRIAQSSLSRALAGLLPSDERQRIRLRARMMHAGIYSPSSLIIFLVVRTVLTLAPPLVALSAAHVASVDRRMGLMWGAIAGGLGFIVPSFWLDRKKARRHAALNRSLPDALDLMVTCVEGGLSLEGALQRVTDELRIAHPMLSGEMGVVQQQIEFGATPDAALKNFADRSDLESVGTLGTLVEQARRFGTSIGEALRAHAEMLRWQREQLAEEMAQKAAVKILFPTLLFIFPAVFVVLVGPAAVQLHETFSQPNSMSSLSK